MSRPLRGLLLVVLLLLSLPAAADTAPSQLPTPSITAPVLDPIVNIPDPNLRAALHAATGVPASEPLRRSDLAALTSLVLESKNIADAEGLQYCKNLTALNLWDNPLTHLPSFAGLTKLKYLNLVNCGLTSWPKGKLPSNLRSLRLSQNRIPSLPKPFTDPCGTWEELLLDHNGLSEFPSFLLGLDGLRTLDLSNNHMPSLPGNIDDMTGLRTLHLSGNDLEAVPASLGDMPNLNVLRLDHNSIYTLPANIGNHRLVLLISNNLISSIPKSIYDSDTLQYLNVSFNRLTSLPVQFRDHTYQDLNVEFNYIDMAVGSEAYVTMQNTQVDFAKQYRRQLRPITGLTATPAADSVTLKWLPGEDGSQGGATWKVIKYVVYLYDGGMKKLADVGPGTQTYTHAGLSPETDYDYRVGVEYEVVTSPSTKVSTRNYTRVATKTLAAPPSTTDTVSTSTSSTMTSLSSTTAETPSSTTVPAQPTTQASGESTASSTAPTDGQAAVDQGGFPLWWIIPIIVIGAGLLGAGIAVWFMKHVKAKAEHTGSQNPGGPGS